MKDNKCIIIVPDCIKGEGSLCSTCRQEEERKDECLTCNDGYLIVKDKITNKSLCSKCPINHCKNCQIINGIYTCIECESNYYLNEDINEQSCLSCDLGIGGKCKTCSLNIGKCGSCNNGYILSKNGSCLQIDNSVILSFKTSKKNQGIRLFQYIYQYTEYNINKSDIKFFLNETEIFPFVERGYWCEICGAVCDYFVYNFNDIREYNVKVVFKSQLTTMSKFFAGCYDISAIKFSPSFDTSEVTNFMSLFSFCEKPLI